MIAASACLDERPGAAFRAKQRRVNIALLCVCAVVEGMGFALLPASMRGLEEGLGLGPARLAGLAAAQGITCAVSGPFWAALTDNGFSKRKLLSAGEACWAVLLTLLASVSSFQAMLFLRALNGVVLAIVVPVSQSMVVEVAGPEGRGALFGLFMFCQMTLGMMPAMIFGAAMSTRTIWGFPGWRIAFVTVGALGSIVSVLVWAFMVEAPRTWRPERISVRSEAEKFLTFMSVPSFRVLLGQGMFSAISFCAFQFMTLHFQYQGYANWVAGMLTSVCVISVGFGVAFGGIIGDWSARMSPNHGRVLTAQLSTILQIPMFYVLFHVLPNIGTPGQPHWGVFATLVGMGALAWTKTGCNRPILSELATSESVGSIMAWSNCFELGAGMLIGPSFIGALAETFFGYETRMESISEMPPDIRHNNAAAMAQAMLFVATIPQIISALIYIQLHFTYSVDVAIIADARVPKAATEKTPIC